MRPAARRLPPNKTLKQHQLDEDLREVLALPAGRRLFWHLWELSGLVKKTMTGNSDTFHKEGRRSVGVELMEHAWRVAPDFLMQLTHEGMSAARESQLLRISDDERRAAIPDPEDA